MAVDNLHISNIYLHITTVNGACRNTSPCRHKQRHKLCDIIMRSFRDLKKMFFLNNAGG